MRFRFTRAKLSIVIKNKVKCLSRPIKLLRENMVILDTFALVGLELLFFNCVALFYFLHICTRTLATSGEPYAFHSRSHAISLFMPF